MVALISKKEKWITLNLKTGHGTLNETQNLAIVKSKNTDI